MSGSSEAPASPTTGQSVEPAAKQNAGAAVKEVTGPSPLDPMSELSAILKHAPTAEEVAAWAAMAPSHRTRTVRRAELMRRWFNGRSGLTAITAAAECDVSVKYFYEMASAWKRTGTLSALGAYTTAKAARGPRIDAAVTNAIQANVPRIVDRGLKEQLSVEAQRRLLEDAARETLTRQANGAEVPKLPSGRTVRTFIEREIVRRAELMLPGRMLVMDCCPVTLRRADGSPHVLFSFIDRGTGLLLGHALGKLSDSRAAYARAAAVALTALESSPLGELPWAQTTDRFDMTFGEDVDACRALWEDYRATEGLPEMGAIENSKRFGAAYRRLVGDRVGRVQFRPSWLVKLPTLEEDEERFDDVEAALRADSDVAAYNNDVLSKMEKDVLRAPPENMLAALRFIAD